MANEENKKVELWAEATKRLAESGIQENDQISIEELNTSYLSLIQSILEQNSTIPVLIVEPDGSLNSDANIKYSEQRKEAVLKKELVKMKEHSEPIRIDLSEENYLLLYYRESNLLRNLRYYPAYSYLLFLFLLLLLMQLSAQLRGLSKIRFGLEWLKKRHINLEHRFHH